MTGKVITLHFNREEMLVFLDHVVCIRQREGTTIVHLDGGQHVYVDESVQDVIKKVFYQ